MKTGQKLDKIGDVFGNRRNKFEQRFRVVCGDVRVSERGA